MKSMTGFGRSVVALGAEGPGEIDVSVRAVNGRFFEARVHAPREYLAFESDIKKAVAAVVARGTVDVYVNRRGFAQDARAVAQPELARSWLHAMQGLATELGLSVAAPTLDLLLKIPDVVQVEARAELSDIEKALALRAVTAATELCDREREREGEALRSDLRGLLQQLGQAAGRIEALRDEANADLARKYRDRLQKFAFEGMVDPQRLAQEAAVLLERADVSEEIARLREHLAAYDALLLAKGPQGKKLDFYAQELLRETNTIGSKSHAAALTEAVVGAKALIERIREQVQNAE
jgi:uncharacterized protein (TIGR00255 family)